MSLAAVHRRIESLEGEATLARSEITAAHTFLDEQGVPRYAHTDFPLPIAQRIRYLVEFGPKQATG